MRKKTSEPLSNIQYTYKRLPNTIYSWGVGKNGELGINTEKNTVYGAKKHLGHCFGNSKTNMLPTQVKAANWPVAVSCFSNGTMYVDNKNDVYGFGSNVKGRMGLKGQIDQDIFFPK